MTATAEAVPVADIDIDDATFQITTDTDIHALKESIRRVGLLSPPLLVPIRRRFRIIAGFRRVRASRTLGLDRIDARVYPASTPVSAQTLLAISDNCFRRPLNLIETSRSLGLLIDAFPDETELSDAAAHLRLPARRQAMAKLLPLAEMPSHIQSGVISGAISLVSALELTEMPPDTARGLSELFSSLPFSVSKQREILMLLKEISIRDRIPIPDILGEDLIARALAESDKDGNQRANAVRRYLRTRRFPKLVEAEARYEEMIRALNLPQGTGISPPPHFESGTHTLTLRFSSGEELKHRLTALSKLPLALHFKNILD